MRPVRLKMQAFGPYAGCEVIDFREAVSCGLFGIYGQTGSGKSTIFSAITFALFGEAAKAEQETPSLRSDHADPAVPTEVEFVFDVGDRRYVVRRRPEQVRPKQRGTGETKDAHEAWLFDATGLAVEEISETRAGKIIAEKKVGAVREAVSDFLGYGAEQFRQIVLLPQGKFETFLAAKTNERLAILRELFDVSVYRQLAAKLKEDSATADQQIRQEREVCGGRLRAEGFESVEALAQGIDAAQLAQEEEKRRETAASQAVGNERAKLEAARHLEMQFQAAEKTTAELDALLQQDDEIRALKERLGNARRAQALADVEGHFRNAEAEFVDANEKRDEASQKSADAAAAAELAVQAFHQERARAETIDGLRKKGETLERHQQTLADAAGLEEAATEATAALAKVQNAFDAAVKRCNVLVGQKRSEEKSLKLARGKEVERGCLTTMLASLEKAREAAEQYQKTEEALEAVRTEVDCRKAEHARAAEEAQAARLCFKTAEGELAAAQALHLAAKLVPGEACPVCGSIEHPAPATGRIEHAGLDKSFREAKAAWEQVQVAEQGNARRLASAEATQAEREDRLSELERPERLPADLCAEIAGLAQKIEGLGPESDITAAETRLAGLEDEALKAEATRELRRGEMEEARQKEAVARDRLAQALSTVPEALRQQDALGEALAENRRALEARRAALEAAEKNAGAAREAALSSAKETEAAAEARAKAELRRDKARTAFEARLAGSGLSEPLYQSYKPLVATIEIDMATIEGYARKLDLVRSSEETARQATGGCERPDLKTVEVALQEAEEGLKQIMNDRARAEARLQNLRKLQNDAAETLRRLDEAEAESAPLRTLAALFNAENPLRLDLETYAIGAMFEQVLTAANQRLGPMTNNRYTLEREIEGSGGRARRGLGIRVFDLYTGKPRSPATLSGGETFIAALALALGLSDVVESVSGKVRLDTIFIDEGFGSLDTENESGTLDQVLQVLTHLVSQRRAVGLISHVPLVQEAIPNGFLVRKGVQGSRVEARGAI